MSVQSLMNLLRDLRRLANLADDDEGHDMTLHLVQTRVDLCHVVLLLTLTKRLEAERFRINVLRHTENVKHNTGRRPVVALTNNHTVTNNEQQFALVVVTHTGSGVDGTAERLLVFGVSRDSGDDELIEVLGHVLATELQSCQELDTDDGDQQNRDSQ